MSEKRRFFACYDYGMGGIWMTFEARSTQEIEQEYPELDAFNEPPGFLSDADQRRIARNRHFDIDDPPTGWLAELVAGRTEPS